MMKINKEDLLTQDLLKELLDCDQDTGIFVWKERIGDSRGDNIFNSRLAGKQAGSISVSKHYRSIHIGITLNKKYYLFLAHRLAWLYMTGKWPEGQIDHIDHDATNNMWVNLRVTDGKGNGQNKKLSEANTSGFTGVCWHKATKKWYAKIKVNSKTIHIGYFTNIQQAIDARKAANIKYGFHENHGGKQMYFTEKETIEIRNMYKDSFKCIKSNTVVTPIQCDLRNDDYKCRSSGCGFVAAKPIKKLNLKRRK